MDRGADSTSLVCAPIRTLDLLPTVEFIDAKHCPN
jgi:hypothetical protein